MSQIISNITKAYEVIKYLCQTIICQVTENCSKSKKNTEINYTPTQLHSIVLKLIKSKYQTRKLWQLYRQPQLLSKILI